MKVSIPFTILLLLTGLHVAGAQIVGLPGGSCLDPIQVSITATCDTNTSNMVDWTTVGPVDSTSCDPGSTNIGLWFSFVAPSTGTATIASPLSSSTKMAIYSQCGGQALFCQNVFGSFDYNITDLMPDSVYYLLVYSTGSVPTTPYQFCLLEGPSCPGPRFADAFNISYDFVDIFYDNDTSAPGVTIEYGDAGFALGTGLQYRDSTESPGFAFLSGLTPGGLTEYYIWEDCPSGAPDTSGPYFVETFCDPIQPDYLNSMDFVPGDCFLVGSYGDLAFGPDLYGFTAWFTSDWLNAPGSPNGVSAVFSAFFEDDVHWLMSSPFDLSGGSSYELSFEIGLTAAFSPTPGFMGVDDVVQLLVSDGFGVWTPILTWDETNPPSDLGDFITVDLSPYTGSEVSFAFYANTGPLPEPNVSYDVFVDNFSITSDGSTDPCGVVSVGGVVASGIYSGGAILSDGLIDSTANVTFTGRDSVVLLPTFQVDLGATFEALIEDCVLATF